MVAQSQCPDQASTPPHAEEPGMGVSGRRADQGGGRDDAVVGAEDGRAKPVRTARRAPLALIRPGSCRFPRIDRRSPSVSVSTGSRCPTSPLKTPPGTSLAPGIPGSTRLRVPGVGLTLAVVIARRHASTPAAGRPALGQPVRTSTATSNGRTSKRRTRLPHTRARTAPPRQSGRSAQGHAKGIGAVWPASGRSDVLDLEQRRRTPPSSGASRRRATPSLSCRR
jgi:hypothetical protein